MREKEQEEQEQEEKGEEKEEEKKRKTIESCRASYLTGIRCIARFATRYDLKGLASQALA